MTEWETEQPSQLACHAVFLLNINIDAERHLISQVITPPLPGALGTPLLSKELQCPLLIQVWLGRIFLVPC
jgi:hypothetical protein